MKRSVDNLEVVMLLDAFGMQHILVDFLHEGFVDLGTNGDDFAFATIPMDVAQFFYFQYLVDDIGVVGSRKLATVVPIGLIAVILFRVVRSGEHHACVAMEVAYGKAKLRGGAQVFEEINCEAVGSQHLCGNLGKFATVVAAIVRDGST